VRSGRAAAGRLYRNSPIVSVLCYAGRSLLTRAAARAKDKLQGQICMTAFREDVEAM